MGGANLKFKTKKYEDSDEIDMLYSSLKYYGRSQTNETVKNLEALLKEKNQLFDLYFQFIKQQQDEIKSLNNRVQMLEKLLFNLKMK